MRLYEAIGLEAQRAKCLLQIGFSYLRQDGPTDQVIDYFTQALEVYRRQGDRFGEHACLVDIANAHLMRGRLVACTQAIEQCLPFFSSINALDNVSSCLFLRGEAYRRMGRLDEALESLRESSAICTQLDRNAAAQFDQVYISATLRDMGRYDEAIAALEQPLRTDDRMIKVRALLVAADIWRIQARLDHVWRCLEEGFVLADWLGSKAYTGIAYRLLAQLRIADTQGQLPAPDSTIPDVERSFAESFRLLREAHYDDELAMTYMAYGQCLLAGQLQLEARMALLQAQALMRQCGMARALGSVQELLDGLDRSPVVPRPGQKRALLARRGAPRGRPLRPDELVEVIWTVDMPQQQGSRVMSKATLRQERLRRLCAEAAAQGAEPTVGDLADALGVAARTVDRDIAALRAAGETLATRGAVG
jgi:tetratricopeptide (TPR) repeat protein